MTRKKNSLQPQPALSDQPPRHSLRSLWQAFHERKPRVARRGSETAHQIEQSQADQPLTFWGVMIRLLPVWALLIAILFIEPTLPFRAAGSVVHWAGGLFAQATPTPPVEPVFIVEGAQTAPAPGELPPPNWSLEIAPIFTPEVQHWRESIANWSLTYRIKPNLIATLIQIESCGNPTALSASDARGLFQVLPMNFVEGEDTFDPETNARRGLTLFGQALAAANGDVGLAFAAYNGGPSIFYSSPAEWPQETQDYQYWGSGINDEAEMGLSESPTLLEWLDKGGRDLCQHAAEALGLPPGS